ncbi:MAG: KH domain-containing protein [Candidatus Firestonebacteria bacterium]|nr:KH domain-containing protein [Candidatus Firestonebacteria bacterium]
MKHFVEYITKNIVDKPENVTVTQKDGKEIIHIEIMAAKDDIGKIVGKNGQTVKALRSILNASVLKLRKRVILDIKEITDEASSNQTVNKL